MRKNRRKSEKAVDKAAAKCYTNRASGEKPDRTSEDAGVAELADAYGSGPYERKFMQVQVLSPAPRFKSCHLHQTNIIRTCFR